MSIPLNKLSLAKIIRFDLHSPRPSHGRVMVAGGSAPGTMELDSNFDFELVPSSLARETSCDSLLFLGRENSCDSLRLLGRDVSGFDPSLTQNIVGNYDFHNYVQEDASSAPVAQSQPANSASHCNESDDVVLPEFGGAEFILTLFQNTPTAVSPRRAGPAQSCFDLDQASQPMYFMYPAGIPQQNGTTEGPFTAHDQGAHDHPDASLSGRGPAARPTRGCPKARAPGVRVSRRGAHVKDRPEMQKTARDGAVYWSGKLRQMRETWNERAQQDASFCACFQPQIDLAVGRVKSKQECLLRFLHLAAADGVVAPATFAGSEGFFGWTRFSVVPSRSDEFMATLRALFPHGFREDTMKETFRRAGLVPERWQWTKGWSGAVCFSYQSRDASA